MRAKFAAYFATSLCGLQWVYDNVGYVAKVEGGSMQPTLNPENADDDDHHRRSSSPFLGNQQDLVALRRINGAYEDIRRGDVITAVCPRNPDEVYIKRIVGLPGDVVETLHHPRRKRVRVPAGHCWMEGDNHRKSIDSNEFGPVPLGLVQSKAVGVLWPAERRRFLTHGVSEYARRVNGFSDRGC